MITWTEWGVWHFGEIDGVRRFCISHMADGTYFANVNSAEGYYGILHKVKDLDEAKRFCNWVARAMGLE